MLFILKLHCSIFKIQKVVKFEVKIIAFILLSVFVLSGCGQQKSNYLKQPHAINGVIDLVEWDFQKNGAVKLDGKWKFYWDKLVDPRRFYTQPFISSQDTIQVPGIWRNFMFHGSRLPDEGYATYRLLVKTNSLLENLALNIKFFISSSKVWVDNKAVYESGVVGNSNNHSKGGFSPQIIPIHPEKSQFYITIQVSNFGYANGGFITNIELGDILTMSKAKNNQSFLDMFICGGISIMALYHFTLFILRRKELSTLYFSIICFLLSIRTLLMGEMLLYNIIPNIPLRVFLEVSGITLKLGIAFFVMFINEFFPDDTPDWFVKISLFIGMFFSTITVITSNKLNNEFLLPFQISSIFTMIIIISIIIKAFYRKREASLVFLIATVFGVIIIINDILNGYGMVSTGYYIPLGLFLFIFIQSFMLFKNLVRNEKLLWKSELRMLQAQIKPHFLFNALNTIIYISSKSSEKAIELLLDLSSYLRCGFRFKNDEEFIDLKTELEHVRSYIALEHARFLDKLEVVFDIDDNINCKIPPLILQPLVENGIQHGLFPLKKGGTLKLSAKQKDNMLLLTVEDNGVGITEDKLHSILKGTDNHSGIGISNINSRIRRIYGKGIDIKSTEKKGTIVNITIPLD